MIKREAESSLKRLAKQFPVIGITGPRQSGKTTLAKYVFPEEEFVSFDNKNTRELAKGNPVDFLLAFPDGAIIDEAQKVPDIFDAIKYHVDNGNFSPGSFILTGSSQFRLKQGISESLSGRIGTIHLMPFTISELKSAGLIKSNPYDMAFNGFYPPFYDEEKAFERDDWFDNYIDTYIDLDVTEQINISNLSTFKKFIQICAIHSGQQLNMESISRNVGVSSVTIKSWLSILEASYIIHLLEPDTKNLGKALVKTPKLYFIDTGLLCYLLRIDNYRELILSNYKGAIIETMAVAELMKNRTNSAKKPNLTYFRDIDGFEVDTIAEWKHTFAIEIKSDSASENKQSKNLRKYLDLRSDDTRGAVFYLGDTSARINNIDYVSWTDWSEYTK